MEDILVQGLPQNNLRHVTFSIPKKSQCLPECRVPVSPASFR